MELMAERRPGDRVRMHTTVTRLVDDESLRTLFEMRLMERQLTICDHEPYCERAQYEARLERARAALVMSSAVSLIDADHGWMWRAPLPDAPEELQLVALEPRE
jgi:hypothetical protein